MFVAIVEPFEEFAHTAVALAVAKCLFNPFDCFDGTSNLGIEPADELLLLLTVQQAVTASILECRECAFAAGDKAEIQRLRVLG